MATEKSIFRKSSTIMETPQIELTQTLIMPLWIKYVAWECQPLIFVYLISCSVTIKISLYKPIFEAVQQNRKISGRITENKFED